MSDDESGPPALLMMSIPLIATAALVYVLYQVLKAVLKRAEKINKVVQEELATIEDRRRKIFLRREQLGEEEFFFEKYGYSYDWVFVFQIHEEPVEQAFQVLDEHFLKQKRDEWRKNLNDPTKFKKYFSMKTIVEHLHTAGLQTKLFYSTQRDEVYCKIRAPPQRLDTIADLVNYSIKLDPDRVRYAMRKGRLPLWAGRDIKDEKQQCKEYGPYEYIYGRYENDDEKLVLYKRHRLTPQIDSPFRNIDRIKLINEIFKSPAHGDSPGCGFELALLQARGCLLAYFPLHDMHPKIALERKWLAITTMPKDQPLEGVKDYFGEKIAMFFAWLGVYSTWLIYASGPGFLTYIVSFAEQRTDSSITTYFATFMALWGTCFLEAWKRAQITYTMEWGMDGYEQKATNRPAFWGTTVTPDGRPVTSKIDGSPAIYFPASEKVKRRLLSNAVTLLFIACVMFVVFIVFQLKGLMNVEPYKSQFTVLGFIELGVLIPSVLNAVSIGVFSAVWKKVSILLNIMENHRTDIEYEDALISKVFAFEFVNKYAACFYAAFAKKYFVEGDPCDPTCFDELSSTLGTLFITELAVGNTQAVASSIVGQKKREAEESLGVDPDRKMSQVEKQYTAETFDKTLGTFSNYQEMTFQFGYATLFSSAFPLAPMLAFINNFVKIRVVAWKLLQVSRRPEPEGCEDIGTWYSILDLISLLSVVTNGLLIFFVAEAYTDFLWVGRFGRFIIFEHILILAKFGAGLVVEDVPGPTEIQLKRQEFIQSKVIENIADDNADLGKSSTPAGFDIGDGDEDPMF